MKMSKRMAFVALLAAVASVASAAPLTGTFNISGSVTVSLMNVDWSSNGPPTGTFATNSPATGDFAGLFCGNPPFCTGVVKDLALPLGPVLRFLDGFTAPGYGGMFFDLSAVILPTAPVCTGAEGLNQACSLGVFTLENRAAGVAIDLGVRGFFQNGIDLTTRTDGTGLYTTQQVGRTVADVRSNILAGGSESAAYSANYMASPIPEPSSVLLFGLGGVAIAFRAYRKRLQ